MPRGRILSHKYHTGYTARTLIVVVAVLLMITANACIHTRVFKTRWPVPPGSAARMETVEIGGIQ